MCDDDKAYPELKELLHYYWGNIDGKIVKIEDGMEQWEA